MLNQITLIGRLVRDPEMRKVGSDQIAVANITLAVDRPRYGNAEHITDFIPVTAWRSTAEFIAKYFVKGQQVYISGRLETRSWEKDGVKHYGYTVQAREVGFADSKKNGEGQSSGTAAANNAPGSGGSYQAPAEFGDFNDNYGGGFDPFNMNGQESERSPVLVLKII